MIIARVYEKRSTDGTVRFEDYEYESLGAIIDTYSQNLEENEIMVWHQTNNGLQLLMWQDLEYPCSDVLCSVHGADLAEMNLPYANCDVYKIINEEEDQEGVFDLRFASNPLIQGEWLKNKNVIRANECLPHFDRKLAI